MLTCYVILILRVLQMHFPSVTIAAQEDGDLTAEVCIWLNVYINNLVSEKESLLIG